MSDKITKKQQSKEIKFRNDKLNCDTPSVSSMSLHGASITTLSPEKLYPSQNKKNKISEILIKGKESIQEPDKPSKKSKSGYYH